MNGFYLKKNFLTGSTGFTGFYFPGFPEEILESPSLSAIFFCFISVWQQNFKVFSYVNLAVTATKFTSAVRQIAFSHFQQESEKRIILKILLILSTLFH